MKIFLVSDKNKNSEKIKRLINKKIKLSNLNKSNIIVVIGGDGFMLHSLKKYYKFNKPFYGINSGNYGFLMNKFIKKNLLKNINKTNAIIINPLEMIVKSKKKQLKKSLAINEVSILRQSKQAANISIKSNKKKIIKRLISDGVLVSTPAGSTAYNLSVHGPILNLNSKKIAITPISPFRPRRWKGIVVSENSQIIISNLDSTKRPISAVADNFEVRNVKFVKIKINKKIRFKLLYSKKNTLEKKIKIEQAKKETKDI